MLKLKVSLSLNIPSYRFYLANLQQAEIEIERSSHIAPPLEEENSASVLKGQNPSKAKNSDKMSKSIE